MFGGQPPEPPEKAKALRALGKRLATLSLNFQLFFHWGIGRLINEPCL